MEPLLLPKVHLTGKLRRVPPDTDLPTSTGGFQTRRPKRPALSPERPLRCGQRHAGIRSRITPAQLLQLGGDLGEYSVTCRESSETSLCGSSDILLPDPMTTAAEVATMTIQQKVLCLFPNRGPLQLPCPGHRHNWRFQGRSNLRCTD